MYNMALDAIHANLLIPKFVFHYFHVYSYRFYCVCSKLYFLMLFLMFLMSSLTCMFKCQFVHSYKD
jgi:hypothetical protein